MLSARQLHALAGHVLGPSGRLAQQKVFTRGDVAVAVGPLLFGFGPRELLRVIEAVCAHPDAIALIDVKAAREQAYSAGVRHRQRSRHRPQSRPTNRAAQRPAVALDAVEAAIGARKRNPTAGRLPTGRSK